MTSQKARERRKEGKSYGLHFWWSWKFDHKALIQEHSWSTIVGQQKMKSWIKMGHITYDKEEARERWWSKAIGTCVLQLNMILEESGLGYF